MKENQHTEFKPSWRDEYLKWICGYANAQGGTLFIGKNDQGKTIGVLDARKLLEEIPNKVRDILGIMVDVNLKTDEGKEYLEIIVEPYPYPISYRGEYHYRSGSTKQELKGAALDRFLLKKQGLHWDGVPVPHLKLEDFDKATIASFRKKALQSKRLPEALINEPDPVLLQKLHLVKDDYFKRAAILLFHPDPEEYIGGAYLKIGYFKNDADLIYHDEIHGNIFTIFDKALDLLLTKYTYAKISYEGIQRVETYLVPEAALREMLLNSLAHKNYASSIPIQISVYDNKIMCWNPGVLPDGWSTETLLSKHPSQPQNPSIANVLFRSGLIEAWGRGFEKIALAISEEPDVSFELKYEPTGLWLNFYFKPRKVTVENEEMSVETEKMSVETEKVSVQTQKTSVEIEKVSVETSLKTSLVILELMNKNPDITLAEVASQIGRTLRSIERSVSRLRKKGKIIYKGSNKKGHWEILN
jgi:ATP-dependent DNA helicase RecG